MLGKWCLNGTDCNDMSRHSLKGGFQGKSNDLSPKGRPSRWTQEISDTAEANLNTRLRPHASQKHQIRHDGFFSFQVYEVTGRCLRGQDGLRKGPRPRIRPRLGPLLGIQLHQVRLLRFQRPFLGKPKENVTSGQVSGQDVAS